MDSEVGKKTLIGLLDKLVANLEQNGNDSASFFSTLTSLVQSNGLTSETLDRIRSCYSITQYASFNAEQESLLTELIDLATTLEQEIKVS